MRRMSRAFTALLVIGLHVGQGAAPANSVVDTRAPATKRATLEHEASAAPDRDLTVSIVVQSETLAALHGVAVRIGGVRAPWRRTDDSGVAFADRGLRAPQVEVDIASSRVYGGVVLDQRLVLDVEDLRWAEQAQHPTLVAHCTLPIAWDVTLPAHEPIYARPWHDRWIVWPSDDWVGGPAHVRVAHLGASEIVRGHVLGRSGKPIEAVLALALLADAPLELPASGLEVSIEISSVEREVARLSISTLQLVDDPEVRASTLAAETCNRRGRFWDVRLRGTLQRGSNLVLVSNSKRADGIARTVDAIESTPGRGLASSSTAKTLTTELETSIEACAGEAARSSSPHLEPIANWPLPACRVSELESVWRAASAVATGGSEHQLSFLMSSPDSGGTPASRPWAFRVLWIGAPAVQVESGSWSHWSEPGLEIETWSGACRVEGTEQPPAKLWFYRRQKRRITRWTITDECELGPARDARPHLAPREVSSVCVQTSGVCSDFAKR